MASTPTSLWMNSNSLDVAASASRSPRAVAVRGHGSPTRLTFEQTLGLRLRLQKTLGTTASSVTGLKCLAERSCFATCAGSMAVLHRLEGGKVVSQRHFRARPNATAPPFDGGQSSTPEWKGRHTGSIRASTFGARSAASPSVDVMNSPSRGSGRQKTRAATCLSLSADGKLLAVGETGHVPRILFFSLAENNSCADAPYTSLSEHTFGIRCVEFSPDSRWLCSVGDVHDGFVFLWSINQRTGVPRLHASNKCTSFVQDMAWMGNKSIVTVGTRHVKHWRIDSTGPPSPSKSKFRSDLTDSTPSSPSGAKTLPGRNCLLGSSLESTFTCVVALSEYRAVVCSDKGDVCLLDDRSGSVTFRRTRNVGFAIKCLAVDLVKEKLWIGGLGGEIRTFSVEEIVTELSTSPTGSVGGDGCTSVSPDTNSTSTSNTTPHTVALGITGDHLVAIDTSHKISIYETTDMDDVLQNTCVQTLHAHSSPVLGCAVVPSTEENDLPRLVTWDSTGRLIFWTVEGEYLDTISIVLEQVTLGEERERNELKVFKAHTSGAFCVSGDKLGVIRVLHERSWTTELCAIKAHGAEVNDIVLVTDDGGVDLIATCSRDRTVQIFRKTVECVDLIQTVDHHASSVNHLLFLDEGRILCSASADRTIVVHNMAITNEHKAFIAGRVMTTKQSPISIASWPNDANCIAVTTIDKQLHKFDLTLGICSSTMRLYDEIQGPIALACLSTRALDSIAVPARLVFGVSATDKSVRVHDMESGVAVLKDYGHSEGLTDLTIIDEAKEHVTFRLNLASTSLDGTVLLWEITNASRNPQDTTATDATPETPSTKQPLRRVLSKTAIAEFSKTLEASGISPLASTPPGRNPSPSRLRSKPSRFSIGRAGGLRHSVAGTPSLPRPNRSPSPPSPVPASRHQRKALHRIKSVDNFDTDLAYAADQLIKSMRSFRKKISSSSSSETLSSEALRELEGEVSLTSKAIGKKVQRRQSSSATNVGDLLDEYSDKLAQIVQEKVNLGMAQMEDTGGKRGGEKNSSENTEPEPTRQ